MIIPIAPIVPIRTLTLGLATPHPLSLSDIQQASELLNNVQARYSDEGYEVQTLRVSTRPLFDDMVDRTATQRLAYAQFLQRMLDDEGLSFCSLGTLHAARPAQPLEQIEEIVDILATTSALSMTVQLANVEDGLREEAAMPVARVIQRLAQETDEGFGNFRFAMLACVEAGCPFFPTAYHAGPTSLSLGLQGASLVSLNAPEQHETLAQVTERVVQNLRETAIPIVSLGQSLADEHNIAFGGIDLSPAPLANDSITAAIERISGHAFGSVGTLAYVAALTAALKNTGLQTCGYNGIMLPVMEDRVLGERWDEQIHVHQLLLYSAICGTGLDTVPLSGNTSAESIARLLLDVATLALRLRKPLSARLFPVVNTSAGERTSFTSLYLTNAEVKDI